MVFFKCKQTSDFQVTYSLPMEDGETEHASCESFLDNNYDKCVLGTFDKELFKTFGCFSPLRTLNQNNLCNIGAFSTNEKKDFFDGHDSKNKNYIYIINSVIDSVCLSANLSAIEFCLFVRKYVSKFVRYRILSVCPQICQQICPL